jgi:uncharacterized protein (TIGR02453 family)
MHMEDILSFLGDLARNNERDWFQDNKPRYQESMASFKNLATTLISGISQFDPALSGLEAGDIIFRIYRDTRFSKDKTPYKTHFGAWMAKGGRKSTDAGYYFHLEPGGSFMAAGVWMPPKEQLHLIRQEILFNPGAFLAIIRDPSLAGKYERGGKEDMLKKGPAGYPGDFEAMEELRYKHHVFHRYYGDAEVRKPGFAGQVVEDCRGLYPFVEYLNHAMSFTGNE